MVAKAWTVVIIYATANPRRNSLAIIIEYEDTCRDDQQGCPEVASKLRGIVMAQPTGGMSNTLTLKTHRDLPTITDQDVKDKGAQMFKNADDGIQTTIMSNDGRTVLAVVGLNGVRYLPDPDPDPLNDLLRLALEDSRGEQK